MTLLIDATSPPADLHRALDGMNRWRLGPWSPTVSVERVDRLEQSLRARELSFVEGERRLVRDRAATAPRDPEGFVRWFEELERSGPGQRDPLFDWLAAEAAIDQMSWFLRQEVAGEAGFEDLVALTQVKMPSRVKLELARNYWDEMGQGHAAGMHGPMLARLAEQIGACAPGGGPPVVEALALANLLVALAMHRRYAYHSIGALGAIELTAPGRAANVNAGLKRLGVEGDARRYFALHATIDVKHSRGWNTEVIAPLIASDEALAQPIAEGALMRLEAGRRCFERYRRHFGGALAVP